MPIVAILSAVALCSAAVQTITGFGNMIVALALGAHFFEVTELVDIFVPLGLAQTSYVLIADRRFIPWKKLFSQVIPVMGAGTATGFWLQTKISPDGLRGFLGALVVALSLKELYVWYRDSELETKRTAHPATLGMALFGAGIMHGMMATGGPLLVYAMSRLDVGKRAFRGGLCAVFWLLNVGLVTKFFQVGRLQPSDLREIVMILPALLLGITIGEYVHRTMDKRRFQLVIFVMLLVAGVTLF